MVKLCNEWSKHLPDGSGLALNVAINVAFVCIRKVSRASDEGKVPDQPAKKEPLPGLASTV